MTTARFDRGEWAGTGAALLFHMLLIGALSLSLAHVVHPPESPPMEVELVSDQVALTAAAPAPLPAPPPPSQAPEVGPPIPDATVAPPTPSPLAPRTKPTPTPPQPAKPVARGSRLGPDFLKGLDDELAPRASVAPAHPAAATVSASAMAGIVQAIRRQIQPCADQQVNPGPGASRIKVRLHIQLLPNGRLKAPPEVTGTSGVDDDNGRFEERVRDLAVATFRGCSPLTGLPPDLYRTASGQGWSNFTMTYNLP